MVVRQRSLDLAPHAGGHSCDILDRHKNRTSRLPCRPGVLVKTTGIQHLHRTSACCTVVGCAERRHRLWAHLMHTECTVGASDIHSRRVARRPHCQRTRCVTRPRAGGVVLSPVGHSTFPPTLVTSGCLCGNGRPVWGVACAQFPWSFPLGYLLWFGIYPDAEHLVPHPPTCRMQSDRHFGSRLLHDRLGRDSHVENTCHTHGRH